LSNRVGLEESQISVDEIALTLPADEAFNGVAHLVLGGLAARLDLTFETLEDLELALDALFERRGEADGETIVRVRVRDDDVSTVVGPFREADLRAELNGEAAGALGLRRILETVTDGMEISEHEGGQWVELTKRRTRSEPG
jgi:anti-sigma regulatory factor (Ser/Thr protein kinase)